MNQRHNRHDKLLGVLAAALISSTLAIACSTSQEPSPTASTPVTAAAARDRDPTILRLLYGRAPETLNPHLATGVQDFEAGRIVLEPLASANADGELVPILARAIPSQENGDVAADGRSVIWRLRQDVQWSDGTPFTAEDVVFTFEFVSNPEVGAATAQYYEAVASVEALDEHTVQINFKDVTAAWRIPFTGQTGVILPQHVFADVNGPNAREAAANRQPVGTGPYQVSDFQPGTITFQPNPRYRGDAPAFEQVHLVAGMAPYAAAKAVLSQGEADFAYNLQVEADALTDLQGDEATGKVIPVFGGLVERIMLNPTHPYAETESGERASVTTEHPFLSDIRVRRAIAYAIDRKRIANELYGFTGRPTKQLLVAPEAYNNPEAIPYEYDLTRARALLDEAGWVDSNGDGIRDRNGVEMEVLFQTSVNPVRQKTQAIVQESLEEIGIEVELKRVRVDAFFSSDPKQTQSINHFYADMQAYTTGNDHPDPSIYLGWWTCDQIAAQANNWQKPNNARYCNPEYDALLAAARRELDPETRASLFQEMDALLAEDVAMVPIVHRAIADGFGNDLTGFEPTPWDTSTWDIANWQRETPEP